jgi:hypothetical protein
VGRTKSGSCVLTDVCSLLMASDLQILLPRCMSGGYLKVRH